MGGTLFSEVLEVEMPDSWHGPLLGASSSTICAVYELASKSGAVVASLPGLMWTQHLWEFCDSRRQKVSFFSLTVFSLPEGLSPGILTGFQGQASPPLLSENTGTALEVSVHRACPFLAQPTFLFRATSKTHLRVPQGLM